MHGPQPQMPKRVPGSLSKLLFLPVSAPASRFYSCFYYDTTFTNRASRGLERIAALDVVETRLSHSAFAV
jgi:hypothetical protein